MEINEKKLKAILKEQSEDFQRQNAVLYEKFRTDVKIIGEGSRATREKMAEIAEGLVLTNEKVETISIKLDATFNMVGSVKEDIEVMKMDVSFIKNGLKQKADKDELEALEKRVLFLERKLKRI